ncbi:MAG: hypothetical protein PHY47_20125 [Lachnospiraceae bacterium]|nr:hypothetical protein [Lachnospiraceae bacterium]
MMVTDKALKVERCNLRRSAVVDAITSGHPAVIKAQTKKNLLPLMDINPNVNITLLRRSSLSGVVSPDWWLKEPRNTQLHLRLYLVYQKPASSQYKKQVCPISSRFLLFVSAFYFSCTYFGS